MGAGRGKARLGKGRKQKGESGEEKILAAGIWDQGKVNR
jgi:hypothetical protein